ncbi:pilus assembly protein [Ralstonia solanacearum]|uniref:pilus assembly PilX family protein n=1 Tax=Ralstonia solanacearum TaxID=305 RepID=UPI0006DCD704|nr:pilus assembly protein [Ralstonia solanacearum]
MLTRPAHRPSRGFTLVFVMAAITLLGLLTMAAFHLMLDHRRRTSLTVDHALAVRAAEAALAAGECELSAATGTPASTACGAAPSPERIAALASAALPGFVAGACGSEAARGLCRPLPGQSLWALASLLDPTTDGVEIDMPPAEAARQPGHRPRYIIEPIPDALPGHWIHAGAGAAPHLFRVTAAGFGNDPAIAVVLQTIYRPRVPQP